MTGRFYKWLLKITYLETESSNWYMRLLRSSSKEILRRFYIYGKSERWLISSFLKSRPVVYLMLFSCFIFSLSWALASMRSMSIISELHEAKGYFQHSYLHTRDSLKETKTKLLSLNGEVDSLYNSDFFRRYKVHRHSGLTIPKEVPDNDLRTMFSAADTFRVPYSVLFRLIHLESHFNPELVSERLARGYMQIRPQVYSAFARKLGVTGDDSRRNNIIVGTYILRSLYDGFIRRYPERRAWELAVASYNMGQDKAVSLFSDQNRPLSYYVNYVTEKL